MLKFDIGDGVTAGNYCNSADYYVFDKETLTIVKKGTGVEDVYKRQILTYITYRITHRYEAEDLTQDVGVRLLDYKQMLRPDTVKYFLFTIARKIVIDYIRRYYKKQEIDSYIYAKCCKMQPTRDLTTLLSKS